MAITFTSGTLTLTGTETIATVYNASVSNAWNIITRTGDGSLGSQYTFSGFTNFDIGDGTTSTLFSAEDVILRFTGLSRMRVRSNAVFRCGNLLNSNATKPCAVYAALGEDFFYTEGTGAYRQYGGLFYAQTRIGREGLAVQGSWEFQNVDLKLGDSITKSLLAIRSSFLHDSSGVAIKLSDPASILSKVAIVNSTFAFQPVVEGTYILSDLILVNIIVDSIFNAVSASTLIFVNPSKLNFTFQGNAGNTAFVRFRFDLNVKNAGSNLQNVRVFVKDGQSGVAFNGLTAANGSITQQLLTYKRWNGTNVSTVTDFSAHTVTSRRYGFVESTLPVVADRDNAFGLSAVVYAFTTLSESAALAITGVVIDYSGKIITLSGAATLSSVHDFLYARACDSTGIQNEIPLVFSSITAAASNYSWVLPAAMTGSTALISLSAGRNVTLSAAGDYSGNKFGISATGVVSVVAGTTDLSGWVFASGSTITRVSGSAIVLVSPGQIANITPGTGVTIRQSPVTLTAPNLTSATFDRVQCRVSLVPGGPINYNNSTGARVSGGNLFVSDDVNITTNTITIAGVNGKITTNSPIRVGGSDLPVPLDPRAVYYPAGSYTSGNAIPLSGAPGGSTIDLIDTGTGSDRWLEVWTELATPLITSGSLSVDLTGSASAAGVSLSNGDFIVLQASHWKGNPQSQTPCTASEYFQQVFQYAGTNLSTLESLVSADLHNQFCVIRAKDGSQVTDFVLDASAPGKIQLDTGVAAFSTYDAALYFYFVRSTVTGLRLLRNNIQILGLNEIRVIGELTIEAQVRAVGAGPFTYRADGRFVSADESKQIDWLWSNTVGVPIRTEVPVDLSQDVMATLAAIASAVAVPNAGGGGSFNPSTDPVIVGSIQPNAITASAIASNAIDADALAVDAVAEIWNAGTRTLTAGTNITLAKGAGLTGLNDITAADVWAAATRSLTDKAGFSLSQAFPANFSVLAITGGGAVTAGTVVDKTGYSLSALPTPPTDWLSAAAVSAAAVNKIQAGLSTYAGGDTTGTSTLLSRLTSTRAGYLDNLNFTYVAPNNAGILSAIAALPQDKTGYSLTALPALPTDWISAGSVSSAAVSKIQAGLSTYAGTDTTGTATLLTRLTATRAGYLDNLNFTYTAPNNTGILNAIAALPQDKTGYSLSTLPAMPADWISAAGLSTAAVSKIQAGLSTYAGGDTPGTTTLLSRVTGAVLLATGYTAPDNTAIANINTRTARLDGLLVNPGSGDRFSATALSNAPIGSSISAADVWAYNDRSLSAGGGTAIAAAVWNFSTGSITVPGNAGRQLNRLAKVHGLTAASVTASGSARTTSDGAIAQTITTNNDGSKTMSGAE